jgi:hypothetical protein
MGHLLEALKQIESRTGLHEAAHVPVVPQRREEKPAPAAPPSKPRPAAVEDEQVLPIDPRYRELLGAILSQVAVRGNLSLLIAGFAENEPRGGQLASFYPLLASRIEDGILVVDADLRNAGVTGRFDLAEGGGPGDVIAGQSSWEDAVRSTQHSQLSVLPAGSVGDDEDRHDSRKLAPCLSELRKLHHLVVVDTILDSPKEMARWSEICDSTVLAVRLGVTPRRLVRETIEAIRARGGDVLGCVLLER